MNWDNITIEQYYAIRACDDMYKDGLHEGLAKLAVAEGVTLDEVLDMKTGRVAALQDKHEYLNTPVPMRAAKKWDGYNLTSNIRHITAGQFIDMMSVAEMEGDDHLHLMMACVAKGKDDDFKERAEHIRKNMPITIAIGHTGFFLQLSTRLHQATRQFLLHQTRTIKKQVRQVVSKADTNGSSRWKPWPALRGWIQRQSQSAKP